MSTSKLGIVTDRSTGDQVGEMQPMDRDQAQTLKKAAQRSGKSVDVKDIAGNNLAEEVSPEDSFNVAKEIAKCLRDALREHGDEIKSMALGSAKTTGTIVKVQYMPDEQGNADEDRFVFHWDGDKLILGSYNNPVEICDLQKQSGAVTFQKDIAKNTLLNFLKSHDNVDSSQIESQPVDPNALPDGPVAEEQLWESEDCQEAFCQAVYNFQNSPADKKEAIKNLFRASRPFKKGNTIQEKLKRAVDWYNVYKENPPKNTQKQVFLEDDPEEGDKELLEIVTNLTKDLYQLRQYVEKTKNTRLGTYYESMMEAFEKLYRLYLGWGDDDLSEVYDLGDPFAQDGEKDPYTYDPLPDNSSEFEDEPVTNEADEYGPEVGDDVDYEGGHYKLYGYCGYEVVLQNVDDERDFKVVTPEAAGIKKPEGNLKESTTWVDPDNM